MRRVRFALVCAAVAATALVAAPASHATDGVGTTDGVRGAAPAIRHVFVVVLENNSYDETFGASSPMPYLSTELTQQGALLRQYYATAHASLANYVGLVSGQGPNPETQGDCQIYTDVVPGATVVDGQALGLGCVYPASTTTVADQLEAAGLSWKAYLQDMTTPCRHPAPNTVDDTQAARAGDEYAARHNPFVYFHSVVDRPACAQRDVDLSQLPVDLQDVASAPQLSLIVPDLCEDGHDSPCVDGRAGGPAQADDFLRTWVPTITSSPAFHDGGLLAITFDEAEIQGDASACCGESPGVSSPLPGIHGFGGGRVGMVLLGPSITPGTVSDVPANHYSFLRTVEDLFGLDHLGHAATVTNGLPLVSAP